MSVSYTIQSRSSQLPYARIETIEARRCDAAARRLWSAIYDMIAGEALLDRSVAYRLLAEFEACTIAPPKLGYYRRQVFKLRPADQSSPSVVFEAR